MLNLNHLYILYNIFEDKLDEKILSSNSNFIFDFIKVNINKDWNWYYISEHKSITCEIIKNNSNLPWGYISFNPNITIDFIKENLDKERTPNLTWKIIYENQDKP